MNNNKTILIFGGTGFVGRAVKEKYLRNNWRVVIPTRAKITEEAKNQLILHGFDRNFLEKSIVNNSLIFALGVDLTNQKWRQVDNWIQLFKSVDIKISSILRIINLVGETSQSVGEIIKSNIDALDSIFTIVKYVKFQNKNVIFVNMDLSYKRKARKIYLLMNMRKKLPARKLKIVIYVIFIL